MAGKFAAFKQRMAAAGGGVGKKLGARRQARINKQGGGSLKTRIGGRFKAAGGQIKSRAKSFVGRAIRGPSFAAAPANGV